MYSAASQKIILLAFLGDDKLAIDKDILRYKYHSPNSLYFY